MLHSKINLKKPRKLKFGGNNESSLTGDNSTVQIVIIVVISIIVIYLLFALFRYFHTRARNAPMLITEPVDATIERIIPASSIPKAAGYEFTLNFWMYVRDWNYSFDHPKCVLYRGDKNCKKATPMIFLYPKTNKLMIRMDDDSNNNMNPFSCANTNNANSDIKACDISNIPIQRWVMVSTVLWNTTCDVYINGKLARSCTYDNIPNIMNDKNIYVSVNGGFNGYISRLQYFNFAITPHLAYQLYQKGPYTQRNALQKLTTSIKKLLQKVDDCIDNLKDDDKPDADAFKPLNQVVSEEDGVTLNMCSS